MVRKVFKIKGMHCTSCAMNVEWVLEDLGVKARCDYVKAQVEVEFSEELTEKQVREAVENEGYQIVD